MLRPGRGPGRWHRHPHQALGGQRLRIALVGALAMDVPIRARVVALPGDLQDQAGIRFRVIALDLPVVRDFAERAVMMQDGWVVEQGDGKKTIEAPRTRCLLALLAASLVPDPEAQAAQRARRLEAAE